MDQVNPNTVPTIFLNKFKSPLTITQRPLTITQQTSLELIIAYHLLN